MLWKCGECEKAERCSCGTTPSLRKIKETFDKMYERIRFTLPEEHLQQRKSGSIHRVRMVNYQFGVDDGLEYLEFYYDPLTAPPHLVRIYADGVVRWASPEEGEDFYEEVEKRGLLYYSEDEVPVYVVEHSDAQKIIERVQSGKAVRPDKPFEINIGRVVIKKKNGTLIEGRLSKKSSDIPGTYAIEDAVITKPGKEPVKEKLPVLVDAGEVDEIISAD